MNSTPPNDGLTIIGQEAPSDAATSAPRALSSSSPKSSAPAPRAFTTTAPPPNWQALAWIETSSQERFPIGVETSFGRSANNQIVLPHEKVSRRHAVLQTTQPGEFVLSDLGSSNGTWLNGQRIQESAPIFDLDRIQIGPFTLTFRSPSGCPRPTPSPAAAGPSEPTPQPRPVMRWLLLVTFVPAAATAVGCDNESPAARRTRWLDGCRDVVEQRGGAVCRYIADGFLASWQERSGTPTAVAHALREIDCLQRALGSGPRVSLHYGPTEPHGTTLLGAATSAGSGVSFVFRMDRLAETVGHPLLISHPARQRLPDLLTLTSIGLRTLPAYEGEFEFFRPG